jgi:hypothetical protein
MLLVLVKKTAAPMISFGQLDANLNAIVYALLLLSACAVIAVCAVHEHFTPFSDRERKTNTLWHWLLALMPANCSSPPNQHGVTRKLLVLITGFMVHNCVVCTLIFIFDRMCLFMLHTTRVLSTTALYNSGQLNSLLV